jgi:hypothetical protein
MSKKIGLMAVAIAIALSASAGDEKTNQKQVKTAAEGGGCFDESTHILNVGVGFGRNHYYTTYKGAGYHSGSTPAFSFSYEQPWPKRLGPGYLGVGAFLGFQHAYFNYDYYYPFSNTYYYHHTWNYYMVAGRAVYHWDVLNAENAEVYAGVIAGLRFQTHHYETNDPGKHDPYSYAEGLVYPSYSVFAGARWYFAKSVAVYGEVGYGISTATVGLSFKF